MQERGEHDDIWYALMTGESPKLREGREFWRWVPASVRCKLCSVPLAGLVAPVAKVFARRGRARKNPNICNS